MKINNKTNLKNKNKQLKWLLTIKTTFQKIN